MDRRYYEEEMRYLHQAGQAFAEAHPEEARLLSIASVSDRDPYVERLFEGFAFLTGRVREQLDDAMPRYTEGLFELLFPHFLRPVPSCAIAELVPIANVQETLTIERGLELLSQPTADDRLACGFRTTQPVAARPLRLVHAESEPSEASASLLRLRFEAYRGIDASALELSPLRLYLHAEPAVASTLYLFLTRCVRRVAVRAGEALVDEHLGQRAVQPAGFAADEALLPYDDRSFAGFRLLHEYLSFRRKFWFVDLVGLTGAALPQGTRTFEVEVHFDRSYPADRRFATGNLRLHCTPIVNTFETDAEPIRADGTQSEYRVRVDARYRDGIEPVDVLRLTGLEDDTGVEHAYAPYFSAAGGGGAGSERVFAATRRLAPSGQPGLYVSAPEAGAGGTSETLSLRVRCTNGDVPRERLVENTITEIKAGAAQNVEPTNLTIPTATLRAPASREGGDYFWELIAHWSLNLQSIVRLDALRELLRLYDWTLTSANQKRARAITDVSWKPKEIVRRGSVVRGMEVTLVMEQQHVGGEGELVLFGKVLSEFLSLYATINAFVHLVVVARPSERRYVWEPERGARAIA